MDTYEGHIRDMSGRVDTYKGHVRDMFGTYGYI